MKLSEIRYAARTVAGVAMWNEATDDEYDALEVARTALPALLKAVGSVMSSDGPCTCYDARVILGEALAAAGIEVDE